MVIQPIPDQGMPLSIKDWARHPGVLCKRFWDRLKPGHPLTGMQRKHCALSTEVDQAEQAAREAMLSAKRETRVAEEERQAELVRLRHDIIFRWYTGDEHRKADKLGKRRRKKSKHKIAGHKDRKVDRRH